MTIGITGGIGSGKTYICNILSAKGLPVYNCDNEAKRLMREDERVRNELIATIGSQAYTADGELNKPAIAAFLFANAENAKRINAIVHPAVLADFGKWCKIQTADICLMESAILFESGFNKAVDHTVLIHAPEDVRIQRAIQRDNSSEEQVRRRMAQQISDAEACSMADYIFDNNGSNLDSEIDKLLNWFEAIKTNRTD